jgi:SEC-C motif-containing protein
MTGANDPCPCGTGQTLEACCGRYLSREQLAPTAEALMRARYTAYATTDIDFIIDTQQTNDDTDRETTEKWSRDSDWLGLEVRNVVGGAEDDSTGTVEFVARYRYEGEEDTHHEEAAFAKKGGRWMLVDGKMKGETYVRTEPKIGPNQPCPCGSGKKYKKCCGKR